jgi:Bacterial PH domain
VLWWGWLALAVAVLADLAVQGRDHGAAVLAAVAVLVTGLMYACALRPRVVADGSGITLVNPVREHHLPWAAVTAVDLRDSLRVHCQGRVLHSWALQSSRRSRARAALRTRAAREPGAARGYGRMPPEARALARQSLAEVAARELAARAAAEQGRPGWEGAAAGAAWVSRWAWWPIAAIAVPALGLAAVAVL